MTEAEVKAALSEWILKKASGKVAAISEDTLLLEQKILSSLHIMDLVLYIEKISGRKTSLAALKPESFKTLATIYKAFFGEPKV